MFTLISETTHPLPTSLGRGLANVHAFSRRRKHSFSICVRDAFLTLAVTDSLSLAVVFKEQREIAPSCLGWAWDMSTALQLCVLHYMRKTREDERRARSADPSESTTSVIRRTAEGKDLG